MSQGEFELGDDELMTVDQVVDRLFGMDRKRVYELIEVGDLLAIQPNRPLGARREKVRIDGRATNWRWRVFRRSVEDYRQRQLRASGLVN